MGSPIDIIKDRCCPLGWEVSAPSIGLVDEVGLCPGGSCRSVDVDINPFGDKSAIVE